MIPVVVESSNPRDPSLASTWASYGARQACEMIGLPYACVDSKEEYDDSLVIAPAHNALYVNCHPDGPAPTHSIMPVLRFQMQADCSPDSLQNALPVLGGALDVEEGEFHGRLLTVEGSREEGPFYAVQHDGKKALRIVFNAPVFETIGIYLSRFSWPDNPGYNGFVRYVDLLWQALPQRWRRRPVVAEYLWFLRSLFLQCYKHLGLPMATCWPHPCVQGEIKHHGLVATHDVDSVHEKAKFRGQADHPQNAHFNFSKWKTLESSLGIKSAFYFFSPDPQKDYWTEPGYTIDEPAVRRAAIDLAQEGWEIAPHELGYCTADEIQAEIAHFQAVTGHAPAGTRNHVLKNVASTLKWKANAGLIYDSTWYAEQTATNFLCGTVYPFAPMDANNGGALPLWEFPFVIEDGIVHRVYGAGEPRTTEEAIEDGRRGLRHILDHYGYACFNWHQRTFARTSIYRGETDNWVTALEHLVKYFQEQSGCWWNPLPAELADFWTRRSSISIEVASGVVEATNTGVKDCRDLVIALQNIDAELEGAQRISVGMDTDIFLANVPVAPGETKTLNCSRA